MLVRHTKKLKHNRTEGHCFLLGLIMILLFSVFSPHESVLAQQTAQQTARPPTQNNQGGTQAKPGKKPSGIESQSGSTIDERGEVFTRNKKIVNPNETTIVNEEVVRNRNRNTGFALFFGLDGGYLQSKPANTVVESEKTGYQIGGKFLGSVYPQNWVFDFGTGWFYSRLGGQEYVRDDQGNTTNTLTKVTILTQAVYVEMAPRYRLTKNWQLGPVLDIVFGADLTFSAASTNTTPVGLLGLQLMYGVPEKTADLRYGIQASTDLTIQNRQLLWLMVSVQMGLPILKPDMITRKTDMDITRSRQRIVVDEKINLKVVVKEVVKFVLDRNDLPFAPKRADLQVESQSFLLELADVLQSVPDTWEELIVDGHVDNQGDSSFNQRLSAARAYAVRTALVAGGLTTEKISHRGHGTMRAKNPNDPQGNSPENQRIELTFGGVSDQRRLNEAISKLLARKRKPDTCSQQGCK